MTLLDVCSIRIRPRVDGDDVTAASGPTGPTMERLRRIVERRQEEEGGFESPETKEDDDDG